MLGLGKLPCHRHPTVGKTYSRVAPDLGNVGCHITSCCEGTSGFSQLPGLFPTVSQVEVTLYLESVRRMDWIAEREHPNARAISP